MYKLKNISTETLNIILGNTTFVYDIEIVDGDNVGTETVIFDSRHDYLNFKQQLDNLF